MQMKKIAILLSVLLPLAIVFTGCPGNGGDPANGDAWYTTNEWTTVISPIVHIYGDGAFHFHVGGGGPGFVEIQRIFLNNTASETGATVIFNGTANPPHQGNDSAHFWWIDLQGNVEGAGTANGRLVLQSDGDNHVHGGGFGSPLLNGNTHIGFVARSTDVGNARFMFGASSNPDHVVINFDTLRP